MDDIEKTANLPCNHEFALMSSPPDYVGQLAIIKPFLIDVSSAQQTQIAKVILELIKNPRSCPCVFDQLFQDILIGGSVAGIAIHRYQYELVGCDWLQFVVKRTTKKTGRLVTHKSNAGKLVIEFKKGIDRSDKCYNKFIRISASLDFVPSSDDFIHEMVRTKQMDFNEYSESTVFESLKNMICHGEIAGLLKNAPRQKS
jgi:hypothetical protein